jgi:hypothetical protein
VAAQTCSGEAVRRPDPACNRPTKAAWSCNVYDAATPDVGTTTDCYRGDGRGEDCKKRGGQTRGSDKTPSFRTSAGGCGSRADWLSGSLRGYAYEPLDHGRNLLGHLELMEMAVIRTPRSHREVHPSAVSPPSS